MDPRRLLPPLAATMLITVLLTGWVALRGQPDGSEAADPGVAPAARSESAAPLAATMAPARAALAAWDEARARAWAHGDLRALRRLYAPGSRTARADLAMLGEYAARDLVVRGLTTQVLSVQVLHQSRETLRIRVTDRVAGGEVVGRDGDVRATLPTDEASTRVVSMRRSGGGGRWLVEEVRDVP